MWMIFDFWLCSARVVSCTVAFNWTQCDSLLKYMICFMPNFINCGWVRFTWQRLNSLSASPVIFSSCIPQAHSMCSINPGWVMDTSLPSWWLSVDLVTSNNLKSKNQRPPLKQGMLVSIIIGTMMYLKILLYSLKLLHHYHLPNVPKGLSVEASLETLRPWNLNLEPK